MGEHYHDTRRQAELDARGMRSAGFYVSSVRKIRAGREFVFVFEARRHPNKRTRHKPFTRFLGAK